MPQTNFGIQVQNQPRSTFRIANNSVLAALTTKFSGPTPPPVTFAFQDWIDTSTIPPTIKQRNAANNAWVIVGFADTNNWGLATIASPTFTGVPIVPTATIGTNTGQIASTAFVQTAITNTPSWIPITLLNGWSNVGGVYPTAAYRKLSTGTIALQGLVTKTNAATETIIGNLPTGYRPSVRPRFPTSSGGGYAIDVSPQGDLIYITANTNPVDFISLNPIRFEL